MINRFFPTVTVIGVNGLSGKGAFYCGEEDELLVKTLFIRRPARTRVIVAHDAKLGVSKGDVFATLEELFDNNGGDVIVLTNAPRGAPSDLYKKFKTLIHRNYGKQSLVEV